MISIVIPTLQKCKDTLENLIKTLNYDDSVDEIIVINNALKPLDYNYDKLRVITPEANIYVNPAWNLGVKEAKSEIVGLLNDDIIIPHDFCSLLLKVLPEKFGVIGCTKKYVEPIDKMENAPEKNDIILEKSNFIDFGFGICMFFKKENYPAIPYDLKIMYGDCWIFDEYKKKRIQNYIIKGQKIFHLGSMTSSINSFNPVIDSDKKNYNKHTIKWYQRIFSIQEYADCVKMRLLGMNIRLWKKH